MDWLKIFSKSVGSAIGITILFPLLQLGIMYFGVVWLAPLPPPAAGISYWGVPWGYVTKILYPAAPYVIEWSYLVYDLIFWFILSFVYYSIKARRKPRT
jgi:hypothetical protein